MLTHSIPPALMAEISTLVLGLMALTRPAPADGFALVAMLDGRSENFDAHSLNPIGLLSHESGEVIGKAS